MTMITSVIATVTLADGAPPLPAPDPLGYPVPAWILQVLAYAMLTLHLTAVHFTVGGALLLLWARLRNKPGHAEAACFLGAGLPLGTSYIITMGIPPLLFVQVLYGQLFYSSSVLIGAYWIQVIPALALAYAGFYYHKLRRDTAPGTHGLVVAIALLLLGYIGYIYVNNFTLLMTPDQWMGLYAGAPGGGRLHHGEPTLHGRYVLFLASSFGVAGLTLIWRGVFLKRWGDDDAGQRSQTLGFRAFLWTPLLWIVGGIGVYAGRPEDVREFLASGAAPIILLAVGLLAAALAGVYAYLSVGQHDMRYPIVSSAAMLAVTACLVVLRDLVRIRELSALWEMSTIPVHAQWGMLVLFLTVFIAGVALLVVLARRVVPGLALAARRSPTGAG
jgi:hypothetical protein